MLKFDDTDLLNSLIEPLYPKDFTGTPKNDLVSTASNPFQSENVPKVVDNFGSIWGSFLDEIQKGRLLPLAFDS